LAVDGVTAVAGVLVAVVVEGFVESVAVSVQLVPRVKATLVKVAVPLTAARLVVPVREHEEVRTIVSFKVVAPPVEVWIATLGCCPKDWPAVAAELGSWLKTS
jgi:hypothetical protein